VARQVAEAAAKAAEPPGPATPKPAGAQAAAKAAEVPSLGTEPTPAPEKKE